MGNEAPDLILCADGGYDHAKAAGIKPDLLIGDLDSIHGTGDPEIETIIYPSEKDDTDTGLCLQTALDRGCRDILIIGGLGGRLDHTMSNIQLITGKIHLADRIEIRDEQNTCIVLRNSSLTLSKQGHQYVSIFSMAETSRGITASGFKYPLQDASLPMGSTLGTSNELVQETGTISVKDGILLVILSSDRKGAIG